jgi:lipoate-protein ligase A
MDVLGSSLRKDYSCYNTRAVESNPSQVANLNKYIRGIKDITEFREAMVSYFGRSMPGLEVKELAEDDISDIRLIADNKYMSWEWNWAYGPDYQFIKHIDYQGVAIRCRLVVREGIIRECTMQGHSDLVNISEKLAGVRHMVEDMKQILAAEKIDDIDVYNFF